MMAAQFPQPRISGRVPELALALVIGLGVTACGAADGANGGTQTLAGEPTADSAGIPIVVSLPDASSAGTWRLSDAPVLEIGTADGSPESVLYQAFDGFVLANGTVVVANAGTRELRFYDARGKHLRTVGRDGEGPGEFRSLSIVGLTNADSIVALDTRRRRISYVAPDGTITRTVALPEAILGSPVGVGTLADGRAVLAYSDPAARVSGVYRRPYVVGVLAGDGATWTPIGEFAGDEVSMIRPPDGGSTSIGVVTGRDLEYTAAGDRIVIGTSDAFSLRVYGADLRPLRLVRQNRAATPVDQAMIEEMLQLRRESAASRPAAAREMFEAALAQMPAHETWPAFGAVRLDRLGYLWVEEHRPPGTYRTEWQVFDPEGRLVGRIRIPEGLGILDIGPDYVLGRTTDALGVEHVRRYALTRG